MGWLTRLPDPSHGPGLVCDRCRYVCDPAAVAPACPPGWGCALALERERIVEALACSAGNQKIAATLLGISRRTLITKLQRHAIERPRKRGA